MQLDESPSHTMNDSTPKVTSIGESSSKVGQGLTSSVENTNEIGDAAIHIVDSNVKSGVEETKVINYETFESSSEDEFS